jgi:hypothetical protein
MTSLRQGFQDLMYDEPPEPDFIDQVVTDGRRGLRRRHARNVATGAVALAVAGVAIAGMIEVFPWGGTSPDGVGVIVGPTAPAYRYTQNPDQVSNRLDRAASHLLAGIGATTTSVHGFTQAANPDVPPAIPTDTFIDGHPTYFSGNYDVTTPAGSGNVYFVVSHVSTRQAGPPDACAQIRGGTPDTNCQSTTLGDGSIVQTSQHDFVGGQTLVAEHARPDGVTVWVELTNHRVSAGVSHQPGLQPLTLHRLVALAMEPALTF